MLKMRVLAFAFVVSLTVCSSAAFSAVDSDGCDRAVWDAQKDAADAGFKQIAGDGSGDPNRGGIIGDLMAPPPSITKSSCARGAFNIGGTGMIGSISSLLGGGVLSPSMLLNLFGSFLGGGSVSALGDIQCSDIWSGGGMANAVRGIDFSNFNLNSATGMMGGLTGMSVPNLGSITSLLSLF